jgi:hypothetical protein
MTCRAGGGRSTCCRSKDLLKERLADRPATRVDLTGFAELLERRVPALVGGVG